MTRILVLVFLVTLGPSLSAAERAWENPVFESAEQAVAAAGEELARANEITDPALGLFLDFTLAAGDVAPAHSSHASTRTTVGPFLLSHPGRFLHDETQRATVARFEEAIPAEHGVVRRRLARFGYPEPRGLVYLRLVDSVDAFSALNPQSSDRMSQVGGVTYYCRYIVLPLSYVGQQSLERLRESAALNPTLDVEGTLRRWKRESFANMVNTFRHELVHVYTNTTLGVPRYADRHDIPVWFHEGTATYLSADPRAGLSQRYQQYQELFFYLVERHGVERLQDFYAAVLEGGKLRENLRTRYGLESSKQLFSASSRWHRGREIGTSLFWIGLIAVVIAALRSDRLPVIGSLMVLFALGLGLALASGLAERLWGLHGQPVVLGCKLVLVLVSLVLGTRGALRIRRVRSG